MKKHFLIVSVFLLFISNYSFAQKTVSTDTLITLERFGCLGICPTYKLTIFANGTMIFEPKENLAVASEGIIKSSINHDQLISIISEFKKINYFSLRNTYGQSWNVKNSKICPESWTDESSVETSLKMNGKSKKVWHYHGCRGTLIVEKLTQLENKIDEITNSDQWVRQLINKKVEEE